MGGGWRALVRAAAAASRTEKGKGGIPWRKDELAEAWKVWGRTEPAPISRGESKPFLRFRHGWTDARGYKHFRKRGGVFDSEDNVKAVGTCVAAFATAAGVVYYTHLEVIPYTKRRHFILLSPEYERKLGSQMYKQVLGSSLGRVLPQDHPLTRTVKRIGKRIAGETESLEDWGGKLDHMNKLRWEFSVIDSPEVNAFVLPGGKVCVYTGLLRILQTDEELAMVLAHEVGHIVARHNAEKMSTGMAMTAVRVAAIGMLGTDIAASPLLLGFELPFSRECEREADAIGLQLMAKACFDPSQGPDVFRKISKGQPRVPTYLSTHPSGKERVANLKQQLDEAMYQYDAKCGTMSDKFFSSFR